MKINLQINEIKTCLVRFKKDGNFNKLDILSNLENIISNELNKQINLLKFKIVQDNNIILDIKVKYRDLFE